MIVQTYTPKSKQRWSLEQIKELYDLPFNDLLFKAHQAYRENFDVNEVQVSTLLSVKTGGCPEDCAYCPQAKRYQTGVVAEKTIMETAKIIEMAKKAKEMGSTRFCISGAYRNLRNADTPQIVEVIQELKKLDLEICGTFGLLTLEQAKSLKGAGLDYYNHNVDTSPEYYKTIITTRTYDDRLGTLENVREAGLKVCSGGIIGMGESTTDRLKMMQVLANLPIPPESVPINKLIPIPGTPLAGAEQIDMIEFIRIVALARIMMPSSFIRLSAGRENMPDEAQAMCFFAGANAIFYGECLLTAKNPAPVKDDELFTKLGISKMGKIKKEERL